MNLVKMFDMQKTLDDHIMKEHPELKGQNNLEWKLLALSVEVGECANEWRGFKKWSKDQEPRVNVIHRDPQGQCEDVVTNPLLEEYVDGLHFIFSIGLEEYEYYDVQLPIAKWKLDTTSITYPTITKQFNKVLNEIGILEDAANDHELHEASEVEDSYENLVRMYIGLGEMLGFTWEQIEQAYMDKNAINHERQNNGY
jgi:dimeric dUTPase (all-alpha-NTP-PPase superfamily)